MTIGDFLSLFFLKKKKKKHKYFRVLLCVPLIFVKYFSGLRNFKIIHSIYGKDESKYGQGPILLILLRVATLNNKQTKNSY